MSEVTQEAFEQGYKKSQQDFKAQQDRTYNENQKKLDSNAGNKNITKDLKKPILKI